MKTVLCLSLLVLVANAVDKEAEKPKQEKRSLELLQPGFYGNLGGVSILNSGYSGIKNGLSGYGTVSTTITPAISYNSGNEFLSQAAFGQESSVFPASTTSFGSGLVSGGHEVLSSNAGSFGSRIITSTSTSNGLASEGNVLSSSNLGYGGLYSGSNLGSGISYNLGHSIGQGSALSSPSYYQVGNNYGVGNGFVSDVGLGSGLTHNTQHNTHSYRHFTQHVPVSVPQPVPVTITKYQAVPHPVPVSVPKPYTVPVHVRVPVEVPKPYAVKVPHKVPVAVPVKVNVEVPKPYPVYHTKEIKVEVEKPVFVKEPITVKYPVPKPYYVEVPTPVKVSVPHQVVIKEPQVVSTVSHHDIGSTIGTSHVSNLGSFDTFSGVNEIHGTSGIHGIQGVSSDFSTLGEAQVVSSVNGLQQGVSGINSISGIHGIQGVSSDFSTLGGAQVVSGVNGIQQGVSGINSDFSNLGVSHEIDSINSGTGINGIYGINSDFGISSFPSFDSAPSGEPNEEKESISVEGKNRKEVQTSKLASEISSKFSKNKEYVLESRDNFDTNEKSEAAGSVSSTDSSSSEGPVVLAIGGVVTNSSVENVTNEQTSTINADDEVATLATSTERDE